MEIEGSAEIVNADCAAAALGYTEYTFQNENALVAVLKDSAGQSGANQLGSVAAAHQGLGVAVNVTVGTGLGSYPDNDKNGHTYSANTAVLFHKSRARGFIRCQASDFFGTAESSSKMKGKITVTLKLTP
jgi:hypothetical protein